MPGRWALTRHSRSKPEEISYFLAYALLETEMAELARIAGFE
ncbi:hypothetical protein ACFW9N_32645 [Streptomyces sp. NPDC059496]